MQRYALRAKKSVFGQFSAAKPIEIQVLILKIEFDFPLLHSKGANNGVEFMAGHGAQFSHGDRGRSEIQALDFPLKRQFSVMSMVWPPRTTRTGLETVMRGAWANKAEPT